MNPDEIEQLCLVVSGDAIITLHRNITEIDKDLNKRFYKFAG